ncbi:metal-dependent hydrolase [Blastococcus sp. SYSU DS0973]
MIESGRWPLPVVGALDEPAHLLTAWLVVAALGRGRSTREVVWVLAGSVAIDVDHLPSYLGWEGIDGDGSRPITHSLATILALMALSAVRRIRTPVRCLAVGVSLHLFRDLATGPGVPLLWPMSPEAVGYPWGAHLAVLSGLTALATLLAVRSRQRSRRGSD